MGRSAPRGLAPLPERYANTEWSPPTQGEEAAALLAASPEDVIAALQPTVAPMRVARIEAVAAARLGGVAVVLEDLHDPHNGGAALRSCEAMGVLEVHVVQNRDRFRVSPKVTQGCDKWLQVSEHQSTADCIAGLRRRGFRVYAAVPGAARPLEALSPLAPAAFLMGNEHFGLSAEARALCDEEFAIPLYGFSESVNLSVATALIVYTHTTRRRVALGTPGDLDPARLTELRARYYARDIRGAAAIVRRYVEAKQNP
jgi:tRNA (guanosine-2'-O-)-methyltransferase